MRTYLTFQVNEIQGFILTCSRRLCVYGEKDVSADIFPLSLNMLGKKAVRRQYLDYAFFDSKRLWIFRQNVDQLVYILNFAHRAVYVSANPSLLYLSLVSSVIVLVILI